MAKRNKHRPGSSANPRLSNESRPLREAPLSAQALATLGVLWDGRTLFLAILLFGVVIAVFLPSVQNDFINFDDPLYITANSHVQHGFTRDTLRWAFTSFDGGFWHPLTWLSIMVDCQFYGFHPGGHHFTSLLLHAANTALLFFVFRRLTGAIWRSALVAAMFGLHPLHVESVAWVAERKDVLSAFFFLLTLWAYVRYVGVKVQSLKSKVQSRKWYGIALLLFVLGLMSKTMVVTAPIIMLLIDFWPLKRNAECGMRSAGLGEGGKSLKVWGRLVAEKIPFFAVAFVFGLMTMVAQRDANAVGNSMLYPLKDRIGNALVSYITYLAQTFWPLNLAVYYPYPKTLPPLLVAGAALLFFALSVMIVRQGRTRPQLVFGWLWYVVTLLPVIGLIQVGGQSHADRYTYVPLIGIFTILAWGAAALTRGATYRIAATRALAVAMVCACIVLTRRQISFWKDSETLFQHALMVTTENELAHNNLGTALVEKGRYQEALEHFQEAVRIMPDFAEARSNLGAALGREGRYKDSVNELREALRLKPDRMADLCNLGDAQSARGRFSEAIPSYERALELKPDDPIVHLNLGVALAAVGRFDEAIRHYRVTLRFKPESTEALNGLGVALGITGQLDEAIRHLREAVNLRPDYAEARCNLGIALVQKNQFEEAVSHFQKALQLRPDYPQAHCNLGVALGRLGRFTEAIPQLQEALRLRPDYAEARENLQIALSANERAPKPPDPTPKP